MLYSAVCTPETTLLLYILLVVNAEVPENMLIWSNSASVFCQKLAGSEEVLFPSMTLE